MRYEFESVLWIANAAGAWRFVTLPQDVAAGIRVLVPRRGPGFGSVRVTATVGATTWRTSVFPDAGSGSYLLPVKAEVRRRERLADGDAVRVAVEIEL